MVLRKCTGLAEFEQCMDLQRKIWGFEEVELIPLRMFVVADKIGGQVLGAFDANGAGEAGTSGKMAGFLLAVPGVRGGRPYLHSHMMGVLPEYRDLGLGRRLKLLQREEALLRDIELVEWTFDPLEIKNAFLNIERLGAIVRRYTINQYGITRSHLHGGLPTDRLVAEWWLKSNRVEMLMATNVLPPGQTPQVGTQIVVPAEISAWKAVEATRDRAAELQAENREAFLAAFANGEAVLGYKRLEDGSGVFQLGEWDEDWSYAGE